MPSQSPSAGETPPQQRHHLRLFDSTMIVMGSMIGSGIFIVSADMVRLLGSPGWLLAAWVLTGLLTVCGALVYGELAGMFPHAGGQYVFLREAWSPLTGFLYGWTLFTVIQTGTIAAVAVAFAKFAGVLLPWFSESNYLVSPVHLSSRYALSLSTAQATAIALIAALTLINMRGLQYGKLVQNVFTLAKTGGLIGLILAGCLAAWNPEGARHHWQHFWERHPLAEVAPGLTAESAWGLVVALGVAQVGSLFSADSWHVISFAAEEVEQPHRNLPLSMALGTLAVTGLYLLANIAYLGGLSLLEIATAPADRVGTELLSRVFPAWGARLMSLVILVSTLGCNNGLILSGARAYFAMARDGLFFRGAARLSAEGTPAFGLLLQGLWSSLLVLPRTFDETRQTYGNLYGDLLDYVVSAALMFYMLTIAGLFRLRRHRPAMPRPVKAWGFPWLPAGYLLGAGAILAILIVYRPASTWPGLVLVASGLPVFLLWNRRASNSRLPASFVHDETASALERASREDPYPD